MLQRLWAVPRYAYLYFSVPAMIGPLRINAAGILGPGASPPRSCSSQKMRTHTVIATAADCPGMPNIDATPNPISNARIPTKNSS